MTIRDWSKTASSNQTAAPGIDWSEGTMLPPTINDSARAMMADVAKWRDDFQGSLTTGGAVNAYTLTTNAVYTSLTDGIMLKVRVNITNTSTATLNIDSLGAKALRKPGASADVALVAGDLVAGTDYIITYGTAYNAAAGGWLVTDPSTLDGSILAALSVGTAALAANAVTNAKLATMATVTVKANVTGGTAVPTDVVIANLMDTVGSTRGTLYYRGASALLPLVPNTAGFVLRDGGSGADPSWGNALVIGTPVASTSGTAIQFTGIPSSARRVHLILQNVSTNGTNDILFQIGPSGGVETSSYSGVGTRFAAGVTNFSSTAGLILSNGGVAAREYTGRVTFSLLNSSTNLWVGDAITADTSASQNMIASTAKALAGVLERIRITTVGGTDTFDAGSINVMWEI